MTERTTEDDVPPRLAVYGTLAPGRINEHILAPLVGRWIPGHVHGRLVDTGWGAAHGYPALALDPAGARVEVQVLESAGLQADWARIDDFEGIGFERVVTTVHTADGEVAACIYVDRAQEP